MLISEKDNFYVITGGPGSGKTSIINALINRGIRCVPEAGRIIIQEQILTEGTAVPWIDPKSFRDLMRARDLQSYHTNIDRADTVIFDRGLVDVLGYSRLVGLDHDRQLIRDIETLRYNRRVFIAPPWREIYSNDLERKQTFEEAVATYEMMVTTYQSVGYVLIELPLGSVEKRAEFILNSI